MLRDAIVSRVHDGGLEPIRSRVPLVDLLKLAVEEVKCRGRTGYEAGNVLNEYRFREEDIDQMEQVVETVSSAIVDAGSAGTRPLRSF